MKADRMEQPMEDANWPTLMKTSRRTGYSSEELAPPLELAWKMETTDYVWASPTVADGMVYFPDPELGVVALDLETGNEVWRRDDYRKSGQVSLTYAEGLVLGCARNGLIAYEARTGEERFVIPGECAQSTPCVDRGNVIWGGVDGKVRSLDLSSMQEHWAFDVDSPAHHVIPTAIDDFVIISLGSKVWALEAGGGDVLWDVTFSGKNALVKPPVTVAKDLVLIAVLGHGIKAIQLTSGKLFWETGSEVPASTPISATDDDGRAYVGGSGLTAVSLKSGKAIWESEKLALSQSAPIIVGDHLYVGGGHWRKIYGFDRITGEIIWDFDTGDLVYSTPAYADGRLLIGSHDRHLYCFRGQEASNPE